MGWEASFDVLERAFEVSFGESVLQGLVGQFEADLVQIARELVNIEALGGQKIAALVLRRIFGRSGQIYLQLARGVLYLLHIPLDQILARLPRQLARLLQQRCEIVPMSGISHLASINR